MTLAGFGPYTRRIGLFTAENDDFYCQYLCLTRPAMDAGAPYDGAPASALTEGAPRKLASTLTNGRFKPRTLASTLTNGRLSINFDQWEV